jgi:hypothetical protein
MRVMARVSPVLRDKPDCIILRSTTEAVTRRAGTVLLTAVSIAANIRGDVLEVSDRRVSPRQAIRNWPKLRYVSSIGSYIDIDKGTKVEKARAVYMVGTKIYYLPEAA